MGEDLERIILEVQQKDKMKKAEEEMGRFLISILYEDDRRKLLNIRSVDEEKYCFITRMLQSFWEKNKEASKYGRKVFVDEEMNYPFLDKKRKVPRESFKYLLSNVDEIDKELQRERQWKELKKKYSI